MSLELKVGEAVLGTTDETTYTALRIAHRLAEAIS